MLSFMQPPVTELHKQSAAMFFCWPTNAIDLCKEDKDLPAAIEKLAAFIAVWEAKGTSTLDSKLEAYRKALEPFANLANGYDDEIDSDDRPVGPVALKFCRAARKALAAGGPPMTHDSKELHACVEKIRQEAFRIPPPNSHTPEIVGWCIWLDTAIDRLTAIPVPQPVHWISTKAGHSAHGDGLFLPNGDWIPDLFDTAWASPQHVGRDASVSARDAVIEESLQYEFPYQRTFDAICASTEILSALPNHKRSSVSVRKFQEVFNGHSNQRADRSLTGAKP